MTMLTELLSLWLPFAFLASGVILATFQYFGRHHGILLEPSTPSEQTEVDPDIRVRVTGRIS